MICDFLELQRMFRNASKMVLKRLYFNFYQDSKSMPPVKFLRQKRYKEKKASEDAAFKKDESDRINALQKRARASETEEEKKIRKEKNRLRMKAKREELRNKKTGGVRITNAGPLSPKSAHARKFGYRTSSSLGKAVRKILAETPSSPRKKKAVHYNVFTKKAIILEVL